MLDPLNSTVAFGGHENPDWPATPHKPGSPIPHLRPAPSPGPSEDGPTPGLYGRSPQIYGQPEAGLISPRDATTSNGTSFEPPEPYLKVRLTGLDRNRRDILVKFDAQTNLTNFTGTTYRNVSRSYLEFQQFYESIVQNNPQTIVAALPLAQTSAPTDEEDDRLVKIMLQRWITRVCEDPILVHDEDLRAFIENDFGYQPTPRPRKKASSGFSLMRRHVPDEDEELQRARFELTKLEGQFFDAAKAVDKLAITRKGLASAHAEMGNRLINVATTEAHPPLGNALRKIGRAWHSLTDLDHAQAISECVILADSLGYQGMNARSAKETLQMRTGVLEEYQAAVKTTISKRRHIERLKASSNIRPEKVDEALADIGEADRYEQILSRRAEGISQNLHRALQTHNRYANDDLTTALIEHARSSIMYERQLLKELEALRTDVASAAHKVLPTSGPPKPMVVPPLEDYNDNLRSAPIVQNTNGFRSPPPNVSMPPHTSFNTAVSTHPTIRPPYLGDPLAASQVPSVNTPQSAHLQSQTPQTTPQTTTDPLSAPLSSPHLTSTTPQQILSPPASTTSTSFKSRSLSPPANRTTAQSPVPSMQQPLSGPTSPRSPLHEPLPGSRLIDGTQSMFITPPATGSQSFDPLRSNIPAQPTTVSPLQSGPVGQQQSPGLNSFGQVRPHQMSQSVRIQPTRPRLDAREAASKLANMF